MLCLWLSILGGVGVRFTQEPSNPSYFNNGSDAITWCGTTLIHIVRFWALSIVFW